MVDMTEERLKAAVVGLGKMGLLHASILNVLPEVELAAVCDKSSLMVSLSKKVLDRCGVFTDVEELCGLDLDVVYVTTPISSHFEIVKDLYSREVACNLFVEKTLASSYGEAEELCSLARSSGGVNMVGYMKRFCVTFKKGKELLEQKALGDVVSFDAYAYSSDFLDCEASSVTGESRGGVLRDLGAHVLDLALWFFGDLEVESGRVEKVARGGKDSAYFKVGRGDGLEGEFSVSWCKEGYRMPEFGLTIKGLRGVMRVNDDRVELKLEKGKSSRWYRHDLDDHVGFLLGDPEYFREDKYFVESVLNGKNVEPCFSTASRVDYIIDEVEKRAG